MERKKYSRASGFIAAYILNYITYIQLVIALILLSVVLHAHILMHTLILETARHASHVEGVSPDGYFYQEFNAKSKDIFLVSMMDSSPIVSFKKFDSISDYYNSKESTSSSPSIIEFSVAYSFRPLFVSTFSIPVSLKMPFSLEK